jgi:hypothetical protein
MEASSERLEIENMNSGQLQQAIAEAVEEVAAPLREEVQALREKLREQRRVITHQEAPKFFNDRVSPRRVKEYIKGKNLPADARGPLPATKRGNLYFIKLEDLYDWQVGELEGQPSA